MDASSYEKSIEALTVISRAITSDQYIEDILRLIVIVTAKVMNSEVCSLWLLDEKARALTIRATQSIDSDYIKERSVKLGEGVVGYVAQHNKLYEVENVLE
jgi:signal transduction protein with GAF and PtsI domain